VLFECAELLYNACSVCDGVARRLRRGKPDLIYERTTSNSLAPTFLARRWKIPIVQEVNVTSTVGRLRPLVLKGVTRAIERWMLRRTTAFVTVSEQFKTMMTSEGYPAERILVCQNAVDPDRFNPEAVAPAARPEHVPADALVAGYVGAFVPYHRLDRLVEVARALAPDYPKLRWLLVGDGVERPKVEALLDSYRLRDRFWMPGAVAHEEVPGYVNAMDVALLPHSERFNSPMKLFEYLAMGKPVVAPEVPAIDEIVTDGINGLQFEAGNVDAFRTALLRALDDAELRARLGTTARQEILANHTWQRNAVRVLEFVQQLVQQRKDQV
jgi:glycosyltransferase involved in cell wall biosynthesis